MRLPWCNNNQDIRILKVDKQMAETDLMTARSALYPQISLNSHWDRLTNVGASMSGHGLDGENIGYSVSVAGQVYTFGKRRTGIRLAELGIKQTDLKEEQTRDSLIFNITGAFYSILLCEKLLEVAVEAYNLSDSQVFTAKKRFEQGLVSEFDLLRARVERSNKRPLTIEAKNRVALARDTFANILNLPKEAPFSISGELKFTPILITEQEAVDLAIKQRVQIKQLQTIYEMRKKQEKLACASRYPNVSLLLNYSNQRPDWGNLSGQWYDEWTASLNIGLPLFTGFRTTAEIKKAKMELEKVDLTINKTKDLIELEIKQIVKNIQESGELTESSKETVRLAKEALRLARVSYENGLATTLDVSQSQLHLTSAKISYYNSVFNYIINVAALERAVGAQGIGH